eukprot:TRINITY_DN82321_c0_g1_i1.p2 TRINITY_DN82321_c0_g1~~TRINITY_DN82321_c0_g1_i1.p2  ORF type:complete len:207 (+),score=78.13 TRINITY_DN82321_c0_g1_i1:68-622(+)
MAIRTVVAVAALLGADAATLRKTERATVVQGEGFWPFDGISAALSSVTGGGHKAHVHAAAPKKTVQEAPKQAPKPQEQQEEHHEAEQKPSGPTLQDVKDKVVLSAAFGHKTEVLCQGAAKEEMVTCRRLAGDRLFCALISRQGQRYAGLAGYKEERERCSTIDIMENSVEATKDEQLQQEAAQE